MRGYRRPMSWYVRNGVREKEARREAADVSALELRLAALCQQTGFAPTRSTVAKVLDSPAMADIKLDCEVRGIPHDWHRREARYSPHSTQSAGFYWKCERCDKETDTDAKPAT